MSGLRGAVTGSDACTASGAGPSNPLAAVADTVFGTNSKTRSRLQEHAPPAPHTIASAATAVERLAGPALPPAAATAAAIDDVTQQFEAAFREASAAPHHAPGVLAAPPHHTHHPGAVRHAAPVGAAIQAFMRAPHTAAAAAATVAAQQRAVLSLPEQLQVRDRSTILARQLLADEGDAVADAQAAALLRGLGIEPNALPARAAEAPAAWDSVWQEQQQQRHGARGAAQPAPNAAVQDWVQSFSAAAWADEFATAEPQPSRADAHTGAQWADEFQESAAAATSDRVGSGSAAQESRKLAAVLQQDPEGKFQGSQFLKFLSKMSEGEEGFAAPASRWADSFAAQQPAEAWADSFASEQVAEPAAAWADSFAAQQPGGAWASEFAGGGADWADAFAQQLTEGGTDDAAAAWLAAEQEAEQAAMDAAWEAAGARDAPASLGLATEYVFATENPYRGNPDAMDAAVAAFRTGSLGDACLALEAVVLDDPSNAQAWRLLGTAHAENDDDGQAIAAMGRALAAEPMNAAVLLALGVSHVNELHAGAAVDFLLRWLVSDPQRAAAVEGPRPADPNALLAYARAAFERAAAAAPHDADILTGLGVTCHLTGAFDAAATAFRDALAQRPHAHSLWNKLGATLANSSRSGEAKAAYARALLCKPSYMRAWANLGISHGNLGEHAAAARFYLKALTLNPRAEGVWGYLKTAIVLQGRTDLLQHIDARQVAPLIAELGVAELPEAPPPEA